MTEAMPFLRKLITFLWPPVIISGALLLWSGNQAFSVKAATLHAGKRKVKLLVPTVMFVNGFGST